MIKGKIIAIDARMIEMSGIGTYIQHLMNKGIYDFAIGDETVIRRYDKTVKVIHYTANIYGLKEQFFFPNNIIKKYHVDLVHFPHYNVPLLFKGNFFVTVHDLTHIIIPEALGNRLKYYYAKFLLKNAVAKSKHIFTVSQNSREDLINYFKITPSKISITYDAVDDDFKKVERQNLLYLYNKYKIGQDKKILLYVGNLKSHKNLNRLLYAFSKMNDPQLLLLLVGKSFNDTSLLRTELKLGIKNRIIHTGMVEKKELIELYNLSDLFVFPSLYEGFGIPPLEAMACGTAVVCSNSSSLPEVVGNAAVLFNPLDPEDIAKAIKDVLYSCKKRNELIKNGGKQYKKFSWIDTVNVVKKQMEIFFGDEN